jgi:hypothetical protein
MTNVVRLAMLAILALASSRSLAQTYVTGTVLNWDARAYSQDSHGTQNQIVYYVRVKNTTYEVSRQENRVEFTPGQELYCSFHDSHLFVIRKNGKETKYDILGVNSASEPPR